MQSVNKVMIIGHVAAEPEIRETKNGNLVASFPLATNRGDRDGGSTVDYHKVVAWGRLAQICQEHVAKGLALYVEGRLTNRSYELADKSKRYVTEVVMEEIQLLSFKEKRDSRSSKADQVKLVTEAVRA